MELAEVSEADLADMVSAWMRRGAELGVVMEGASGRNALGTGRLARIASTCWVAYDEVCHVLESR